MKPSPYSEITIEKIITAQQFCVDDTRNRTMFEPYIGSSPV